MAQEKPIYEVVSEFAPLATALVEKYPEVFYGIEVSRMRCVKIKNKDRKENKKVYEVLPVKNPVLMDSPYGWYVTVWHNYWDAFTENQKLLLIADVLQEIPTNQVEDEGKVVPCDVKAHSTMIRTFKGIDYLDDPSIPHLLNEQIEWITSRNVIEND